MGEGKDGWIGGMGGVFWVWLNTHQWSYVTRTDRRIEGWLRRNGWAEGWAGGV